jgi:FkbM family methyltransferase
MVNFFFNIKKNMTFGEYLLSYIRYFKYVYNGFFLYKKTFKNYFHVIKSLKNEKFPIKCILQNNEIFLLNKFQVIMHGHNLLNFCEFTDEILTIQIRDLPKIRMLDMETNGDFFSGVLFDDEYEQIDFSNKTVIDIGANNGDTPIYFAMRGAKQVIALEPLPANYEFLVKNIQLNNLEPTITPILAACSSKKGSTKVLSTKKGVNFYSGDLDSDGIEVPIISLTDILKNCEKNNLILKFDCEGCEYDTILNTEYSILQKFEQIIISYHYGYLNIAKHLENLGFDISFTKPHFFPSKTSESRMYIGFMYAKKR